MSGRTSTPSKGSGMNALTVERGQEGGLRRGLEQVSVTARCQGTFPETGMPGIRDDQRFGVAARLFGLSGDLAAILPSREPQGRQRPRPGATPPPS